MPSAQELEALEDLVLDGAPVLLGDVGPAQAAQEAAEGPEDLSDTAEFPPAPQAEEEPEEEPVHGTRRIDFGNLQFGRDYEIK